METKSISRIEVILSSTRVEGLVQTLNEKGVPGITIANVIGCGTQKGAEEYDINEVSKQIHFLPKQMLTIFTDDDNVDRLIEIIKKELYTGHIGNGKIFISPVSRVIRVRTGEEGAEALR